MRHLSPAPLAQFGCVAGRPAKTEPRNATTASNPLPRSVRRHGRGSGSKHVAAGHASVRSWSKCARKSRPRSSNAMGPTRNYDKLCQSPARPSTPSQWQGANDRKRRRPQNSSDASDNEKCVSTADKRRCFPRPPQEAEARTVRVEGCGHAGVSQTATWMDYKCPSCQTTIQSTIRNGKVKVRGHCGKQFRVRDGLVARGYTHSCPKCGTEVQSPIDWRGLFFVYEV